MDAHQGKAASRPMAIVAPDRRHATLSLGERLGYWPDQGQLTLGNAQTVSNTAGIGQGLTLPRRSAARHAIAGCLNLEFCFNYGELKNQTHRSDSCGMAYPAP